MDKNEYRAALGRLPIVNPTEEDIKALCPHLTIDEAMKAFTTDSGYLACPPLKVRGAFQIIGYQEKQIENVEGCEPEVRPAKICWSLTGRSIDSYPVPNPANYTYQDYKYSDKAITFAENNWGQELIVDDWSDVVKFIIEDPRELVDTRWHKNQPRLVTNLYVSLDCKLDEINPNKQMPESVAFDSHISQMTIDALAWYEIKAKKVVSTHYNCAYCGSPLSLFGCDGCGYKFEDNNLRCADKMPLSEKMVNFLRENGHEFGISPKMAQFKEKRLWGHNISPE